MALNVRRVVAGHNARGKASLGPMSWSLQLPEGSPASRAARRGRLVKCRSTTRQPPRPRNGRFVKHELESGEVVPSEAPGHDLRRAR